MLLFTNKELLKRRSSLSIQKGKGNLNRFLLLAIQEEVAQMGYTLSGELLSVVKTLSEDDFLSLKNNLHAALKELKGGHKSYPILYKEYPFHSTIKESNPNFYARLLEFAQIAGKNDNMDLKVMDCGHVIDITNSSEKDALSCPVCQSGLLDSSSEMQKTNLPQLDQITPLKIINLAQDEEIFTVVKNLLGGKSSLSDSDRDFIIEFTKKELNGEYVKILPENFSMKEQMAFITVLMIEQNHDIDTIKTHYKTATDVLRLATGLAGGDVSLTGERVRFKLKNAQRVLLVSLIDAIESPLEDMKRRRQSFLHLGKILHVGKYAKRFPAAVQAFDVLRNNEKSIVSFNTTTEVLASAIISGEEKINQLADHLSSRPGEYIRKLDFLLRNSSDTEYVISKLESAVKVAATPLLLNEQAYIKSRTEKSTFRCFIPKGNESDIYFIDGDDRDVISQEDVDAVFAVISRELATRFTSGDSLGKVFIDPSLKSVLVPLSQRNASDASEQLVRGSRIKIQTDAGMLRFFQYWKADVDLDLTVFAFSDDWSSKGHVSYSKTKTSWAVHSGDILRAPNGAAECVDVNVEKCRAQGIRYLSMFVNVFSGESFSEMSAFAGVMERKDDKTGEMFEASSVLQKFNLTGSKNAITPIIFDIQTMEMIWVDMSHGSFGRGYNADHALPGSGNVSAMIMSLVDTKPNMFDLFNQHALSRAESVVYEREEGVVYDKEFNLSDAMKIDDIIANYM
jgi:hypothetical protein